LQIKRVTVSASGHLSTGKIADWQEQIIAKANLGKSRKSNWFNAASTFKVLIRLLLKHVSVKQVLTVRKQVHSL
jgi:hypothetical protein